MDRRTNNPLRLRNNILIVGVICAAIVLYVNGVDTPSTPIVLLGGFAVSFAIIAFVAAFWVHLDVRSYRNLQNPRYQIARWTITPELWAQFLARNDHWNNTPGVYPNSLDVKQQPPLQVIATRRAILIGDNFHDFGNILESSPHILTVTDSNPPCLELCGTMFTNSASIPYALRVPVPASEVNLAQQVLRAWRQEYVKPALYLHEIPTARRIAYILGPVGPVLMPLTAYLSGGAHTRVFNSAWGLLYVLGLFSYILGGGLSWAFLLRDLTAAQAPALRRARLFGLLAAIPPAFVNTAGLAGSELFSLYVLLIALPIAPLALIYSLRAHMLLRRQERILHPSRHLAQWTISPELWQAFQPDNEHWNNAKDVFPNHLPSSTPMPASVTLVPEGVLVSDTFYDFKTICTAGVHLFKILGDQPACIEICGRIKAHPKPKPFALRFPIPPDQMTRAQAAVHTWQQNK